MRFPHMQDDFPPLPRDTYANGYDYRAWGQTARVKVMAVPWDSPEDGAGANAVWFGNDATRDAWFDARDGETVTFETATRVKPDGAIKLPLPFDVVSRYNYLMVDYGDPAPVAGGAAPGRVKRFFWFIAAVEYGSPSATRCILEPDWWTTYINDMRITYAMLQRGHAAVAAAPTAEEYLKDPVASSEYLMTPDMSAGSLDIARAEKHLVINDEVCAVIVTYANPRGSFGTKGAGTWNVPDSSYTSQQGAPAPYAFSVPVSDLGALMAAIDAQVPQLKRCILGVFLAPVKLITYGDTFALAGRTCRMVTATRKTLDLISLNKQMFGYPEKVAWLAKLYTYPYAVLEVTDETGALTEVRVEDTDGTVRVSAALSLVWPFIAVDAHLIGVGGVAGSMPFATADARDFPTSGRWYETLRRWDVPVYAVTQGNDVTNDYATHYDRAQAATAYTNGYASATASNNTAYTNAANSAKNMTANNALTVAANTATTTRTVKGNVSGAQLSNDKLALDVTADIATSSANYAADQAGLAVAASNNDAQAAAGAVSTVVSAVGSLATGNVVGAATSALSGAMNTATSWSTANASIGVSQSNSTDIYTATINQAVTKRSNATSYTTQSTAVGNAVATDNVTTQNETSTSVTNNNANLTTTNAGNARDTGNANAGRSRDTAASAVSNQIKQAALGAPNVFGSASAGATAVTRPMALQANVVTQRTGDIMSAADAFLRYGYALNRNWHIESLQVMRYYTYWQCESVWISCDRESTGDAVAAVKRALTQGVTVWSDPDKIGQVSIYDNTKR